VDSLVKMLRNRSKSKKIKNSSFYRIDRDRAESHLKASGMKELICGHTHQGCILNLPSGSLRILPPFEEKGAYLFKEAGKTSWELRQVNK
jgi:UDP-2,3-diacylglucosamine pyrophosphatase LpxH